MLRGTLIRLLAAGLGLVGACGSPPHERAPDTTSDEGQIDARGGAGSADEPRTPDEPASATAPDAAIDARPPPREDASSRIDVASAVEANSSSADADKPKVDAGASDAAEGKKSDGPVVMANGERLWFDGDFQDQRVAIKSGTKGDPVPDWYKPINYHDGTIQVRLTVTKNDPPFPMWQELIFWAPDGKHSCLNCLKPTSLEKPGDYTCSVTPKGGAGWFCNAPSEIDWSRPLKEIDISTGGTDTSGNRVHVKPPAGFIFKYHYTAVLVPAGQKFSGWQNYPKP